MILNSLARWIGCTYFCATMLLVAARCQGQSPPGTNGACSSPAADLVAWWPLNGTSNDIVGNASLTFSGGPSYGAGQVGQGIVLDGVNDSGRAGASSNLNVGAGGGMTVECWINPAVPSRLADIVEWNSGGGSIGVHLSTSTQSASDFYANLVDTAGVSHQAYSGPGALTANVFQHIAMTYDKGSGIATMYINGNQVARTNLGTFTPQTSFPLYVGTRASGVFQGIWFPGVIDELSLYRRALSAAEVHGVYAAGTAGKCTTPQPLKIIMPPQNATVLAGSNVTFSVLAQGTPPLRYQWLFNGAVVSGAVDSALSISNAQPARAGSYAAVVSDVSGSVTSAVAALTVFLPLSITTQPASLTAVAGTSISFSVAAQGTDGLAYQWFFHAASVPGATASNLVLGSVAPDEAGSYFVVVSDSSHSITSAPAILNVLSSWSPVINEFLAQNTGPLTDEDGATSDWIEIFNPGPGPVNLLNWCLTDDPANLTKWRFPATNLAANGYLIVFASGKNRAVAGAPLHTNFKLDGNGEYLALVEPDGLGIASQFAPAYPPQRDGVSYGLGGGPVYFLTPTPGGPNGIGVLGFVADTKFDTNRGFFFAPFDLRVDCTTPGAIIVYTTNGDEPMLGSGVQVPALNSTSPPQAVVHIANTTSLRAAAFKQGYVSSAVDTHTYIFPSLVRSQTRPAGASSTWIEDPPGNGFSYPADFGVDGSVVNNTQSEYSFTNALMAVPTLSVVTPMDGIFGPVNGFYTHAMMDGSNWERHASIELLYPDGRPGFHVGAGVGMHGGVSRLPHAIPKHPFRLFFGAAYGPTKLNFPLMPNAPVEQFDQLVLRACSTDAWPIANLVPVLWDNSDATYLRDQWMRDAQLAMGHVSARGIYLQLYVNGCYWGLYNVTERYNDSFFADRLGGQKADYDIVTDFDGHAFSGDRTPWTQLLAASSRAPTDPTVLWQIQGLNPDGTRNTNYPVLINLDNFIDYMALHIYAAAIDWPGRNWWAARKRTPDSDGFHFFTWDQEIALDRLDRVGTWGNAPANIEAVYEPNTPGQVYDGLRRDPEFQLRFADRLQKHLFNGGALTLQSNIMRWAARAAEMDHAIVGESARWGNANHSPAFTREADWLRTSNFVENVYFPSNLFRAWQRFKNVGLYPNTGAPTFNQFGGNVPVDFRLAITHTNPVGTVFYTIDGSDPRLRGGAIAPSAVVYGSPFGLVSPTLVRARVKNGTNWSAVVEAEFYPPQDLSKLQLSEIMYNPPKFGVVDGDEVEFLELKNTGVAPLDLSGLTFTAGIVFTFTNQTVLAPSQYFVLGRNAAQFAAKYGGAPLNGLYTGKLNNAGETIALSTALGAVVFSVTYKISAPWPAEADNTGFSLQRMSFSRDAGDPAAWIAALPTPGGALPAYLVDSDGDGMPDGWEIANGLNPNLDDSGLDADNDGMTNYQEFIAGTDPHDAGDALRVRLVSANVTTNNRVLLLGFLARSNKTYSLVYQGVPGSGNLTKVADVGFGASNRFLSFTEVVPANSASRFYRLATPRLP